MKQISQESKQEKLNKLKKTLKKTEEYGDKLLQARKEYQDLCNYIRKHQKVAPHLLGNVIPTAEGDKPMNLTPTKRLDYVWTIEMIIIVFLLGIVIFQGLKIKALNKELYAEKRYSHHLKEIRGTENAQ